MKDTPAFPRSIYSLNGAIDSQSMSVGYGMTLRDYFAAKALPECMNLVNAFCGDIDIAHLLMQSIVDHICEEALVMFNSESE